MKRLILIMVMVVSVGTVEARHPTLRHPYGSISGYGYGRRYGDSDAGKMIAAGQLILAISHAVGSYETTHRILDMGERAQREEYQNRRDAQSAGTIYGVTEPQKIVVVVETPKERPQEESESRLSDSENQKLRDEIKKLKQQKKALEERQKLQKILDALEKDVQKLKSSADPNST